MLAKRTKYRKLFGFCGYATYGLLIERIIRCAIHIKGSTMRLNGMHREQGEVARLFVSNGHEEDAVIQYC